MKQLVKTAAKVPHSLVILFLGTVAFAADGTALSQSYTGADIILKNGRVYTDKSSERGEWSQAISIRDGNILSIGTTQAIEKEKGPTTKIIDLKGRVVLPGFNDAHFHISMGGVGLSRVELTGVTNVAQMQEKLRAYAQANPGKRWIFGQGWDHTGFTPSKYPTKEDVDAVISDKPVMLWHTDRHFLLVNSKGLEELKITAETPNPKNGEIQKDAQGKPTGILLEDAANEASARVDAPSHEELKTGILAAQDQAMQSGVTSIQGGPMPEGPVSLEGEAKIIDELYRTKQLHLRYSVWGNLEKPQEILAIKQKYKTIPEEWVRFDTVKGFVDGVLSSRTAALLEPYSDDKKVKGAPNYTQDRLNELVFNANRLGLAVALHAVGDRAVAMATIAFAKSKTQLFNSRIRNRIEHLEVVPPYIYPKLHELGVIVSMQPSHMIYTKESENYNLARLGPVRLKHAFAWRNFWKANDHMAFGTDFPVMPINPMIGLFGAVYRQNFNGKPARGWTPEQKLTMSEALEAYTLGGAYATREDHVKGSLREGKYADLVVFEQDPFKLKSTELLKDPVYMTIVGGQVVYDNSVAQLRPAKQ